MRPLLLQLLRATAACSSATAACGSTPHFLLLPPLLQHSVPRQAACLAGGGAWGHPRLQQGLSSSSGEGGGLHPQRVCVHERMHASALLTPCSAMLRTAGEGDPPEAGSGGSPSTSDSAPHEQLQQQPVDGQEGGQPSHPSSTISSASSSSSSSSSSASRISSGSSSSDSSGNISSTPDVAVARAASSTLRSADDVFGAPGEQQGQQPPLPTAADVDLEEAMSSRAPARVRVEQHEPTPGARLCVAWGCTGAGGRPPLARAPGCVLQPEGTVKGLGAVRQHTERPAAAAQTSDPGTQQKQTCQRAVNARTAHGRCCECAGRAGSWLHALAGVSHALCVQDSSCSVPCGQTLWTGPVRLLRTPPTPQGSCW